jgi:hypothetical protein
VRRHLQRHGAIYIVGALWLLIWVAYAWLEWRVSLYSHDAVPWHMEFWRGSAENMQSEAWQIMLAALVVDEVRNRRRWFRAGDED